MKRRGFFGAMFALLAAPLSLMGRVRPKKYMVYLVTDHGWRAGHIAYPTAREAMARLMMEQRSYPFSYYTVEPVEPEDRATRAAAVQFEACWQSASENFRRACGRGSRKE